MYSYDKYRPYVFSEEGQEQFLRIRDRIKFYVKTYGACTVAAAIKGECGTSFNTLACVDRVVELGDALRLIHPHGYSQYDVLTHPNPNT